MSVGMNTVREPAALLLEDGTCFVGQAFGARGQTTGEVVFNTSMTGYQEILTDPSYRAQLVTMTYPHIGNTGVNPADVESERVQAAGLIVREAHEAPSSWRSSGSLHRYLERNGVIALTGIDTRALVRRLRQTGAMRGALVTGDLSPERLREVLATEPPMEGRDLASEVSCKAPYDFTEGLLRLHGEARTRPVPPRPARPYRVVAYDFGIKRNILRLLVDSGCEVTVVPAKTSAEDVLARDPDGIFLSNGPGDPAACIEAIANVRALIGKRPIFGICLGHQILARATSPCETRSPGASRSPARTMGSRWISRPCRRSSCPRTSTSTMAPTRASRTATCRSSACSTTQRRAPVHTTPTTSSRAFGRPWTPHDERALGVVRGVWPSCVLGAEPGGTCWPSEVGAPEARSIGGTGSQHDELGGTGRTGRLSTRRSGVL